MDSTPHAEDCRWRVLNIKKTFKWYANMGIKDCPTCGVTVEVTDEDS